MIKRYSDDKKVGGQVTNDTGMSVHRVPVAVVRDLVEGSGGSDGMEQSVRAENGLPATPIPWIGEETRRALPPHVYKYYLARTKDYATRRQSIKVL